MTPAAVAWIILGAFVVAYVAGFDTWAHFESQFTMTHQMDVWLQNHASGPFIIWFWTGALPAWLFHLWQTRNSRL